MIAIIDFGMGNLGSIKNMLYKIGVDSIVTSDIEVIESADKLILPGVGAFDHAVESLKRAGLISVLNKEVMEKKKPILGICLGMQLMSKRSEEGSLPGLGWIDAETIRFNFEDEKLLLRVPHMGWNTIQAWQEHLILEGVSGPRFYFVHSYHVRCRDESNVLAATMYGITFHSIIVKDNIIGMQFHPEKSHKYGMQLLRNYAEKS